MYFYRYYSTQSVLDDNANITGIAALLLACKYTDEYRKLEDIISQAVKILKDDESQREQSPKVYREMRSQVILREGKLLSYIGFDLFVDMPHEHMLDMLKTLVSIPSLPMCIYRKEEEDGNESWIRKEIKGSLYVAKAQNLESYAKFTQMAWSLINDFYMSPMCLCFRPDVMAGASLYLAYRQKKGELGIANFDTLQVEEGKEVDDEKCENGKSVAAAAVVSTKAKGSVGDSDGNEQQKKKKKRLVVSLENGKRGEEEEEEEGEVEERGIISENECEKGEKSKNNESASVVDGYNDDDPEEWMLDLSLGSFWYKHLRLKKKDILKVVRSASKLYKNTATLTEQPMYACISSEEDEDDDDDDDDDDDLNVANRSSSNSNKGGIVKENGGNENVRGIKKPLSDNKDSIKMIPSATTSSAATASSVVPPVTAISLRSIPISNPHSIKTPSSSPPINESPRGGSVGKIEMGLSLPSGNKHRDAFGGDNDGMSGDRRRVSGSDRKKSGSGGSHRRSHQSRHGGSDERDRKYGSSHGRRRNDSDSSSDSDDDGGSRRRGGGSHKRSRYSRDRYSKPGHSRHRNEPYERK